MSTSGGPSGGGGGSGTVTSVTAADTSVVIGGTPTVTPTVATNTLDVIAADHPPAANWSNNSKKITSLANGSAAQDAAAFGQIPTALPPNGSAGGDLTGTYPNPTVKASVGLTGTPTAPTAAAGDNTTQIATDAFVTTAVANAIAGVNPAVAVQAATAAVLPNSPTYNNGASGIGATLTTATTNTALVVDGYTPVLNDRVLVKNQAAALQNGVYTVTQVAALGLAWILTRALDYDQPSDINNTGAIPVVNGTANTATQWVLTSAVTAVGTDALTFTQFSLNPATILTNTLTSAHLLVGSSGNVATDRAVSGDVTIGNTGVTAIGAAKVTNAMLAGSIDLTSKVTGALPVGNGGTGLATLTAHGVLVGAGASNVAPTAAGTLGQQLTSGGASADPSFTTLNQLYGYLSETGTLAATYDRSTALASLGLTAYTSGQARLCLIALPLGITVTNLTVWAGNTAGASMTHAWMALCDINRNQLAISADNTTAAWTANTSRTFGMTTPYQVTASGPFYVVICVVGTTMPNFESIGSLSTTGSRAAAPIVSGTSTGSLTTPGSAPGQFAALSITSSVPFVEVS